MMKYIFRLVLGLVLLLFGLWLMGRSAYMSIPIASVIAALFGLLMTVIGLVTMFKRPSS